MQLERTTNDFSFRFTLWKPSGVSKEEACPWIYIPKRDILD